METIFSVAFPFKDKFHYMDIPASLFAMDIAIDIMGDGMLTAAHEHDVELTHRFVDDGKNYLVCFAYDSTKLLNIWETTTASYDDENYDENMIARDVPYTILKVTRGNEVIYNITDL